MLLSSIWWQDYTMGAKNEQRGKSIIIKTIIKIGALSRNSIVCIKLSPTAEECCRRSDVKAALQQHTNLHHPTWVGSLRASSTLKDIPTWLFSSKLKVVCTASKSTIKWLGNSKVKRYGIVLLILKKKVPVKALRQITAVNKEIINSNSSLLYQFRLS